MSSGINSRLCERSKLCKHSFSEHALMQLLRQNGQPMVCPISGCSQLISQDILFKNHVLAQKVERVKKQEAQKNSSSSDVSVDMLSIISSHYPSSSNCILFISTTKSLTNPTAIGC
jgi:hypothetical protein